MAEVRRWPGRPNLLPDETLASWFARVAQANGLLSAELYRVALPGSYLYRHDLDRSPAPDLLTELAARTGARVDELQKASLMRWVGRLYDEDDGRCKLPWLPPAGTAESRRSFGQQFCPDCLREDEIPYFRAQWRIAFVTVCDHHNTILKDRCSRCADPVQPSQLRRRGRHLLCPKCGADLCAEQGEPAEEAGAVQQQFLAVAEAGWGELGAFSPLHSLAYFRIALLLFRLLASGRFALPLREWVASRWEHGTSAHIPRVKEVELLIPERRLQVLRMIQFLMDEWPKRVIDACRAVDLAPRHLIKSPSLVPFAFLEPVSTQLAAPVRKVVELDELLQGKEVLHQRGEVPTYKALRGLFGVKFQAHTEVAEPVQPHVPYGKGRYWKLDGVDAEVRQAVLRAAHRDRESVAAWVERVLRKELQSKDAMISPQSTSIVGSDHSAKVRHAGSSYPTELP